ncbi:hypothetical protein BBBOND_0201360 [Babesia bigemina]|uniref:Uncharacterized protein n=1 Tax=Babesia bigemina TaxID=5866 RepID=A0A061D7U4_BABBI|nr:hypothetical protein BBBOND_0201360 [Babesia bigemina]CDR94979.1 hypothetical protein BBBOND_0201360 [Babesia bigemina]|eukprot:XP_012767165.1 hypothetical protein BBBOND_0201360 [Babesia bigemina]
MIFDSLTEAPRNLKEGIDWLIALKEGDAVENVLAMGTAVHKFLADKPVGKMELPALENYKRISQKFLEQPELKGQPFVSKLLGRFKAPLSKRPGVLAKYFGNIIESDYQNVLQTRRAKPEVVAANVAQVLYGVEKFLNDIKDSKYYNQAYSGRATWEASCSKSPEACAQILVGIAPMLYTGLRSLKDATEIANKKKPNSKEEQRLGEILNAVGYTEPERQGKMGSVHLLKALSGVDEQVLAVLYDLAGFWAFY